MNENMETSFQLEKKIEGPRWIELHGEEKTIKLFLELNLKPSCDSRQ